MFQNWVQLVDPFYSEKLYLLLTIVIVHTSEVIFRLGEIEILPLLYNKKFRSNTGGQPSEHSFYCQPH